MENISKQSWQTITPLYFLMNVMQELQVPTSQELILLDSQVTVGSQSLSRMKRVEIWVGRLAMLGVTMIVVAIASDTMH